MKEKIDLEERIAYKHTKLGIIPKDWQVKQIGEIAKVGNGATPRRDRKDYWHDGRFPWLPTGKVNERVISYAEEFITDIALKESSVKLLPIGTILLAMIGQGKTRGKVAYLNIESCINQNFAYIKPNDNIYSWFLFHYLEYQYLQIRGEGRGGNQDAINCKIVKDYLVAIPSLPEQKAIADTLSTWDKGIEKLQQLISAKKKQKEALMQQLLTGKKRFKEFTDEWQEVKYGDMLKQVKRPVEWNDEELYDLISVRRRSGGLFHRESLFGHQILTKDLYTARKGDFLISKMQILHGASGLTTEEFDGMKVSGSYISVVAKNSNKLDIEFFCWLSKLPNFYHQTYIASYGVHIEKMTFDFKTFLKLSTQLPPIKEQRKIVNVLNAAEKELEILQQKLNTLNQQKKGLMHKLLTGQVRVNLKKELVD
ncbi:hypothetical protein AAE02nite_21390 [Adhaeribacter aerolatus]|uniref:Type I restriction modification DNA specificity domain-containing protein n=1 Tax=Adhaeribacter aerolatus TaxID=670289 RepID=A0A512AXN0_9BACT|nr:restriction endonuclease subunit S [Adhaeribacter aerolatus]GEO04475.1 hypothetical protein AAE02nite_21390 [Adhaeribacter aerolatus]